MGTWDDGIFDNDSALDALADLVDSVPLDTNPAHLAAGLGLRLWIQPSALGAQPDEYQSLLHEHAAWVAALPPAVRDCLQEIEADPEAASDAHGSRPEAIRDIVGGYCDGPMNRVLLCCSGADEVIGELAHLARAHLDANLVVVDGKCDPLETLVRPLAALGLLVSLSELGVRESADDLERWQAVFVRANRSTTSQREFWDRYAARVNAGFRLLKNAARRNVRLDGGSRR